MLHNTIFYSCFSCYYHTDNHGWPRMTRRIISITRTSTDGHGRYRELFQVLLVIITRITTDVHGELFYHTDNHGWTRMTRRIISIRRFCQCEVRSTGTRFTSCGVSAGVSCRRPTITSRTARRRIRRSPTRNHT